MSFEERGSTLEEQERPKMQEAQVGTDSAQIAYAEVTPREANAGGPESLLGEVKVPEMRQDLICGAGIKDMNRGPSLLRPRSVTVEE